MDPFILLATHVGQPAHGRMHHSRQVPFDKARVAASDRHFGGNAKLSQQQTLFPIAIAAGKDLSCELRSPITRA